MKLLLIAAGGVILLENPQNSLIALHDRWVWLVNALARYAIEVPWLFFPTPCSPTIAELVLSCFIHETDFN